MMPVQPESLGKIIQREFTKQAEAFSRSREMREKGGLEILPRLAAVKRSHRVLDLACGPGFVALEFAKHGPEVIGVDLTAAMLKKAREMARRENLRNVTFRRANVNRLPFADESFDLVVTRASFHHFSQPDCVLGEMVRVVKRGGRILISDNTSSDETAKRRLHNRIEKLRDPSHAKLLPVRAWRKLFRDAGLQVVKEKLLVQQRNAEDWMKLSQTPSHVRRKIRRLFIQSMRGDKTGQNVRLVNGQIVFNMNYRIFVLARGLMKIKTCS